MSAISWRTIYNTNFENRITRMSALFPIRVISALNSCIVLRSFIRDITLVTLLNLPGRHFVEIIFVSCSFYIEKKW
jgi:hypothetical protein